MQSPRLADASGWPEWLANWQDDRLKLQLIRSILAARRAHAALFACGDYRAVAMAGPLAAHALAFGRRHGQVQALVVGTRFSAKLAALDQPILGRAQWRDTTLQAGHGEDGRWVDVLTSRAMVAQRGQRSAIRRFPL
ncbi:hypothetical protein [Cupriavidus sp. UME77]|uniref:hypothetical protein n=1 Tax=Cupriavidus sp. UME77 TaxID=1862321 RepID=UPI0015FFB55B|nr:hypothetical protein [Cupriavidus sp. UME77]